MVPGGFQHADSLFGSGDGFGEDAVNAKEGREVFVYDGQNFGDGICSLIF